MQRFACILIAGMLTCLLMTAPAVALILFQDHLVQNITLSDPVFSLGIPEYDRNLTKPSATLSLKDPALNIELSDPSSLGIPGYGNDESAFIAPEIPPGTFVVVFTATKPVFLEGGFMIMPGF